MQTLVQRTGLPAPRIADAGTDVTNDPAAAAAAGSPAQKPDAPPQSTPSMKDTLDEEQRFELQEQTRLLIARQQFDLANEERSEIMREEGALRDMLMAALKDEDAYLKKWIELI